MVSDNDITYAQSLVRRALEELTMKKQSGSATPEEIKKLEDDLRLRERDADDLKRRQRNEDDQLEREKRQKELDDKRKRFA